MITNWTPAEGPRFRVESGPPIDVTMMSRPDEGWSYTDAAGHEHYWTFGGKRGHYSPTTKSALPTLRRVVTGTGYYPDGESYQIAHYECRQCGERVEPRKRSDDCRQYIPGLRTFYINDEEVSPEAFEAAWRAEAKRQGIG
jgi:hypothetical protein